MKALAIFLVGLAVAFGALAMLINLSASQTAGRVFVVVDSSFPMREVWTQVVGALDEIEAGSFSEFALATEKAAIHSWQDQLRFPGANAFAPCDFRTIEAYTEASDATERVLITTSASCPTGALIDWRVIMLEP